MAERDVIVAELKRALRERGHTYAAVAKKLECTSPASSACSRAAISASPGWI